MNDLSTSSAGSPLMARMRELAPEMCAIRRDIHRHPELAYEEKRTAGIVAERLRAWRIDVHEGIGGTGVVGVLSAGTSTRAIGLRADMDALPIREASGLPYESVHQGRAHSCGHDGHTAQPHLSADAILCAAQIVTAAHTLVARRIDPNATAVLSLTRIAGGASHNVMPAEVAITGTVRSFDPVVQDRLEAALRDL